MRSNEVEIRFEPLTEWTEKDPFNEWKTSHFKVSNLKTIPFLKAELAQLGATKVVIRTMHRPNDIRKYDNVPRSDRQPPDSGVIVEFEKPSSSGPVKLRFPCRTFKTWEDNLRAIALALEALRKVDRYGVTTGAQYAGYKALPPGGERDAAPPPKPRITAAQAAEFIVRSASIGVTARQVLEDATLAEFVYKTAAKVLHPDKEGGSQEEFAKLEESMSIVRNSFATANGAGGGA
jgi:hypothetical protein